VSVPCSVALVEPIPVASLVVTVGAGARTIMNVELRISSPIIMRIGVRFFMVLFFSFFYLPAFFFFFDLMICL